MRPRPRLRSLTYREIAAGCVMLIRGLENGKIRHFHQIGLSDAVERAAKREVRGSESGVWLWGITASGGDITTLVAATKALCNWDQYHAGRSGSAGSTGTAVTSGPAPIMAD